MFRISFRQIIVVSWTVAVLAQCIIRFGAVFLYAGTNSPRYSNLDGSALRSVLIDEGLQLCTLAWQNLEQAESVFKRAEGVEDTVDAVRHARSCMMVAQERALQARVALADQNAKEWVFEADTATALH